MNEAAKGLGRLRKAFKRRRRREEKFMAMHQMSIKEQKMNCMPAHHPSYINLKSNEKRIGSASIIGLCKKSNININRVLYKVDR